MEFIAGRNSRSTIKSAVIHLQLKLQMNKSQIVKPIGLDYCETTQTPVEIHVRPARLLLCLAVFSACFTPAVESQSSTTRSVDFASSRPTGTLGRIDPAAAQEITSHRAKVAASAPWSGMQGSGQIQYGDVQDVYQATVTVLGTTKFRLDAQAAKGNMSIRIDDTYGMIQEADGRTFPLVPETAATGLFQFELPRLPDFADQAKCVCSLMDRGVVTFGGQSFHQLTYEFAMNQDYVGGQNLETVSTDLFFDVSTNLLSKSSNIIRIDGAGNHEFQRVISYDDYRLVGDSLVPFQFTQTLNGQKQWTLNLSDVQLNPSVPSNYFAF